MNFFFFKAILAAAAPDIAPFMADECLLAIPEIEGIDYTTKEYLNFVWHIQNTADRLSKECKYDKFYFLFFFVKSKFVLEALSSSTVRVTFLTKCKIMVRNGNLKFV